MLNVPFEIFDAFNPVKFAPLNDGAVCHTGVAAFVPVPVSVSSAVDVDVFPASRVGVPVLLAVTMSPSVVVNPLVLVGAFPLVDGALIGAAAFNRNAA